MVHRCKDADGAMPWAVIRVDATDRRAGRAIIDVVPPMKRPSRLPERRGPGRPIVGDTASCSRCAAGLLEFTERYRIFRGAEGRLERVPAWVCDACPHVVFVRSEHHPTRVRATSRKAGGDARRLVKARPVREEAGRAPEKKVSRRKLPVKPQRH